MSLLNSLSLYKQLLKIFSLSYLLLVSMEFTSHTFAIAFSSCLPFSVCVCVQKENSVFISISPAAFGKAFPAEPQSHLYFKWPQKVA